MVVHLLEAGRIQRKTAIWEDYSKHGNSSKIPKSYKTVQIVQKVLNRLKEKKCSTKFEFVPKNKKKESSRSEITNCRREEDEPNRKKSQIKEVCEKKRFPKGITIFIKLGKWKKENHVRLFIILSKNMRP